MDQQKIKEMIEQRLPGAKIIIDNFTPAHIWHKPNGDYLSITVTYAGFKGKTLLQQHQMIYDLLAEQFKSKLHALQLKTKI